MTDTEIKLTKATKATKALNELTAMVKADHSIRKDEAWVGVNNTLAVLNGTIEMPDHWRDPPAPVEQAPAE